MSDEFRSYPVDTEGNLFDELLASVCFEEVAKGRQGAVLVQPDESRGTPIVRTTTKYSMAAQSFQPVHARLAQQVIENASLQNGFNNALIECYTNEYKTMGAHSDQALDLENESHIAIFSCYEHPELPNPPRKLIVKLKEGGDHPFEIPLPHNSVVVFSLSTNRQFKHKIMLETSANMPDNRWLGITYRRSQTFIRIRDERTILEDGTLLRLATEDQAREFYRLRGRENREPNFKYPSLPYTLSQSDMLAPIPA